MNIKKRHIVCCKSNACVLNKYIYQVTWFHSTGLLFVYWIANFVVPELIMKDLQSDNTDEDQETKQDDSTD